MRTQNEKRSRQQAECIPLLTGRLTAKRAPRPALRCPQAVLQGEVQALLFCLPRLSCSCVRKLVAASSDNGTDTPSLEHAGRTALLKFSRDQRANIRKSLSDLAVKAFRGFQSICPAGISSPCSAFSRPPSEGVPKGSMFQHVCLPM